MRRILVDNARRKGRVRHGGQMNRVEMDDFPLTVKAPDEDLLAVHEALDGLAQTDAQAAELVKLHYFLGLSMDETADCSAFRRGPPIAPGRSPGPGSFSISAGKRRNRPTESP